MPQVGKWTTEGKAALTPEQLEEQARIRTPGCGTGIIVGLTLLNLGVLAGAIGYLWHWFLA